HVLVAELPEEGEEDVRVVVLAAAVVVEAEDARAILGHLPLHPERGDDGAEAVAAAPLLVIEAVEVALDRRPAALLQVAGEVGPDLLPHLLRDLVRVLRELRLLRLEGLLRLGVRGRVRLVLRLLGRLLLARAAGGGREAAGRTEAAAAARHALRPCRLRERQGRHEG